MPQVLSQSQMAQSPLTPQGGGGGGMPSGYRGLQTGLAQQVQARLGGQTQMLGGGQPGAIPQAPAGAPQRPYGQTNLTDMANYLAGSYGIQLGRQPLVDERGNFMRMPQNADEAVKFQFISQALADEKNKRAQQRSVSAIQAGIGAGRGRARGGLQQLMSGQYEALAQTYGREQHRGADFSYFVQKEQLEKLDAITRRMEKLAKKRARGAMIGGLIGAVAGTFVAPGVGTAAGYQIGAGVGGGAGAF